LRAADAALDRDQAKHGLVEFAAHFIEVLAKLSAGAEIIDRGSFTPLRPGSVTICGRLPLWRNELIASVTTTRAIVERSDTMWIARLLLEEAAFRLDKLMLSSEIGDTRGLLHRLRAFSASVAINSIERDVENLKARLDRYAAGAVFIAAPAQAKKLDEYRCYAEGMTNVVRHSAALANGTVIAVADDAIIAGIGEPRVDAARVGLEKVELRLHLPLAWSLRDPAMVSWMKGVQWGEDEAPKVEPEIEPWPGLSEREIREVGREFATTLLRTDAREADKRLVAHLKHFGCPRDQLAAWAEQVKALPLGTL
jgi:hypothetical protein